MKRRQQKETSTEQEPTAVASPDTDVESFGPWLRQHRELRDIDRREVADASKISVRYIEALETNRFEILPAEVFTKGFLRQYAAYVGLDPEEVVSYYLAAAQAQREQQEPDLEPTPEPRGSRSANLKWLLAAMVVGALLISVVWLLFRMSEGGGDWITGAVSGEPASTGSASTDRGSTDRDVAEPGIADRGPTDRGPTDPRASTSLTEPALGTPDADEDAPEPVGVGPDAEAVSEGSVSERPVSEGSVSERPVSERPAAERPAAERPAAEEETAAIVVVVDFSGDCWVEATLDEGRRLAEMHVQGESLRLEAESAIDLKLGDARMVQVQVNGIPYPLTIDPRRGSSVVNVRFDRQTLSDLQATNAAR